MTIATCLNYKDRRRPYFLWLEGAPIPIGDRMAPHQPTKLNHKLLRTLDRVAEIPHVNPLGTDQKKARGVRRPFGRGVEERECPSTTAVVAGPHIQNTTLAADILLRLVRHNHIHVLNRTPGPTG
jgi:hypothetical protein